MSWAIGWSRKYKRWIGYGVPCTCEHPECSKEIDRGMDYLCEKCRLAFCGQHHGCPNCDGDKSIQPKPEHPTWLKHLREDESWAEWRSKPKNLQQLEAWERATQATATK